MAIGVRRQHFGQLRVVLMTERPVDQQITETADIHSFARSPTREAAVEKFTAASSGTHPAPLSMSPPRSKACSMQYSITRAHAAGRHKWSMMGHSRLKAAAAHSSPDRPALAVPAVTASRRRAPFRQDLGAADDAETAGAQADRLNRVGRLQDNEIGIAADGKAVAIEIYHPRCVGGDRLEAEAHRLAAGELADMEAHMGDVEYVGAAEPSTKDPSCSPGRRRR